MQFFQKLKNYAFDFTHVLSALLKWFIYTICAVIAYGHQVVGIIFIGFATEKFMELCLALIGFATAKIFVDSQFHVKSFLMCTLLTWWLFYMICTSTFFVGVSMFMPLILGAGLPFLTSWFTKITGENSHVD